MQFAVLNDSCNVTVYTYYLWEQEREKVFGRTRDLVLVGPVRESRHLMFLIKSSVSNSLAFSLMYFIFWIERFCIINP